MTGTTHRPAAADLPLDAVAIPAAAKLLGLTAERVRQLIRAGYAASPARGHVRLMTLLSGYIRFLKEEASRPESEGVARQHTAKAQLIEAATARRRAELLPRADAEQALDVVLECARRHIKSLTSRRGAARGLPAAVQERVAQEVDVALGQIAAAHRAAITALKSGDFTALEGSGHDAR